MANQSQGGGGGQRPNIPGAIKVGTASRGPQSSGGQGGSSQVAPGAGMAAMAPELDLRAVSLVSCEKALQTLELRDRKGAAFRLRANRKEPHWTLEQGKPPQVRITPINQTMATDLFAPLGTCLESAKNDALLKKYLPAALEFLTPLATAAGVPMPSAGPKTAAATVQAAPDKSVFSAQAKDFTGKNESLRAPPAVSPIANARPAESVQLLTMATPGLNVMELRMGSVQVKRGFVEFEDNSGGRLSLQQVKFTPPPQFTLEFAPPGEEAERLPVQHALALELALLVEVCMQGAPQVEDDAAVGKGLKLMIQALLKVP